MIARFSRMALARSILRRRKAVRYHTHIVTPAAIVIQKRYRILIATRAFTEFRDETKGSCVIQRFWRGIQSCAASKEFFKELTSKRRDYLATVLQSVYRGFKGRRRAVVFKKNAMARRVNMAGVIRRAWLGYVAKRRVKRIKEVHEVKEAWATRKWLKDEGGYIGEDMDSVQVEMKRLRRMKKKVEGRIEELRDFRWETERRIPEVEDELDKVTEEDVERGWAEAFETEWDQLTNQLPMSEEELKGKKIQLRDIEWKLEKLQVRREEKRSEAKRREKTTGEDDET